MFTWLDHLMICPDDLDILTHAGIAIFSKDASGRYLAINEPGAAMLYSTVDRVVGAKDVDLFSRSSAVLLVDRDQEIMRKNRAALYEAVAEVQCSWKRFLTAKLPFASIEGQRAGLIGISALIDTRIPSDTRALFAYTFAQMNESPGAFIKCYMAWSRLPPDTCLCVIESK